MNEACGLGGSVCNNVGFLIWRVYGSYVGECSRWKIQTGTFRSEGLSCIKLDF